ncbi:MAG: hypothetical protein ABFD77_01165 [Thermotogota bacterium]
MRLITLVLSMTLTAFFAAAFPASADDGTGEGAEVVQADEDLAGVRPAALIEIPAGMVLRPRADDGTRTSFRPDQEYKCFTSDEWAQMGHLVTDYRWLWYYAIKLEMRSSLFEAQVGNLELQLQVLRDDADTTRRGLESMSALLQKEHERRLNTETVQRFELWAWRVATVVGLVAAGAFGAAYGVERSR